MGRQWSMSTILLDIVAFDGLVCGHTSLASTHEWMEITVYNVHIEK